MKLWQLGDSTCFAFVLGLLALVTISCSAQDASFAQSSGISTPSAVPRSDVFSGKNPVASDEPGVEGVDEATVTATSQQQLDHASEAARAYKQAMSTLSTLTAHLPTHTHDPSYGSYTTPSSSFLSSFLPSPQGQGPLGSFMRILIKLHQQSWLPRIMSGFGLGKQGLGTGTSKKKEEEMRGKAIKVVDLLHHSADLGNSDALYALAQISLFPPNVYFPSDPALAYHSLVAHASKTGNASSQSLIAFFHASGYHQVVPVDQAKAQLYYTFAALGGDKNAQMALGYRSWAGIGTLEDCGKALEWYEMAAGQAMTKFLSGPPGGMTLPQTPTRLSDLAGGVYGPGASVASTGLNAQRPAIRAGMARAAGETWEDVLDYYMFNADRGETDFAVRLGKIYYQGSIYSSTGGIASGSEGVGAVSRDVARARFYFLRIARQVWPLDPTNPLQYVAPTHKDESGPVAHHAAVSAGYLGRMALRGEGVKADPAVAKMWFERGATYDDKECHNGLGIIWRDGLVGRVDMKKALLHFAVAAGQDLAEAQANLGKHHYDRGEFKLASTYFETAIRHGSPFEAYYYMATVQAAQARSPLIPGAMTSGYCAMAVSFYKLVAERGVWDNDLLRDAEIAWNSGTDKGKELAILKWWIASESGFEVAQNNMAYVLDQDKSILRLTRFSPIKPSNDTARLALTQWTRSAAQTNVDSLVKVGDYYYHGLGMDADEATRLEKAARYYQTAADTQMSALAMWNLGWMYENGVGVPQDFYLAKRHYDMAFETNSEAYLPVTLSLGKLYVRSIWHTLMGGRGGLSLWHLEEEDSGSSKKGTGEARELDGKSDEGAAGNKGPGEDGGSADEDDGPWYLGKAREEFHRRRRGPASVKARNEEEDPIQWARDRRSAGHDRDGDYGPDEYLDGTTRGHRGEDTDEFWEMVLLISLCLLVSVLLYVRTRVVRAQQHRQQQQQGGGGEQPPQPNANGGLFPPQGDPARNDWAILR